MAAFLASGAEVDDSEIAESSAEYAQDELAAFYCRERACSFRVMFDKRVHSDPPKSELSIDERRKECRMPGPTATPVRVVSGGIGQATRGVLRKAAAKGAKEATTRPAARGTTEPTAGRRGPGLACMPSS